MVCRRSFRAEDKSFAAEAAPTKLNQPPVGGPLGPNKKVSQLNQLLQQVNQLVGGPLGPKIKGSQLKPLLQTMNQLVGGPLGLKIKGSQLKQLLHKNKTGCG